MRRHQNFLTAPKHSETETTALRRMAHRLLFIAGFIMLVAGVVNLAAAASISFALSAGSQSEASPIIRVIAVVFILSILCFIGSGCGWDAAMEHMKGEKTSKLTIAKKAFLVFTGVLTIIEGRIYWNSFGFGPVIAIIGILATVFSVPDLFYSSKGEEVQQNDA